MNRLEEMTLEPYMISLKDEADENNEWYVLLTGAEADTIAIEQLKTKLQIEHQLEEVQVLNYNNLSDYLSTVKQKDIKEVEKIVADRPDIPESVYELVEKFPKNNLFSVKNISLHSFPDEDVPRQYMRSFYDTSLDLPRGVKKRIVAKNAAAFAEVIYEDNLYGDQVTVDVIKLRDDHGIHELPKARLTSHEIAVEDMPETAEQIAWYFSTLILNTGRYRTETYDPIYVPSFIDLYGYKVVIEPRKDYVRTYMVLVDAAGSFVIFSQSTDKTDEEILAYLEEFGKSNGMLEYNEFHNTFFTIPKCLEEGDVFLGYSSSILTNSYAYSKGYAKWAKAMVGHSESSAHFYNTTSKKSWTCSSFDLITKDKKDYIYGDMYSNTESGGKEPIKVNKRDGFFVHERWMNYNEVNFSNVGRHVMAVGGVGIPKEELMKRAVKFQSGEAKAGEDPCEVEM
jgi:hypothetical protein